jgi:glycopeptide antibiotics resistance protein
VTFDPAASPRVRYVARLAYVGVILLATLTHLHIYAPGWVVSYRLHRALHLSLRGADVVDAARNVLLFAGFGAVWLITSPRSRSWWLVLWITAIGCALSVSVETVQLLSPVRLSSINDVITNTLGALLGAAVLKLMTELLVRVHPPRDWLGMPLFTVAGSYLAATVADTFSPLYRGLEMTPPAGGSILNRLVHALHYVRPFVPSHVSLTDIALYLPAGVLTVAALMELSVPRAFASVETLAVGALIAGGVEILHGIAGQPISLSAIAGHMIGFGLGVMVAWRAVPWFASWGSAHRRALLLLGAYALVLTAWAWRPFELRLPVRLMLSQITVRHLTPLGVLGASRGLFGVMDLAEQFALYMPLGFLLAVWPLRHRGWLATLLPGIYLTVVLEVGQIAVRGRIFDVTDLLTQCAAVCVGFLVARRAGYIGLTDAQNPGESSGIAARMRRDQSGSDLRR